MTNKKRKRYIIVFLAVAALISSVLILKTHTVFPSLIEEYSFEQAIFEKDGYCYFFVQSDKHYCFNGNGLEELKIYAPKYNVSELDTDNYNYIVAINCEIDSISYSYKTAYKTMSLGIDTYIADADLTKTHDNTVRIYKMKNVNIDYDYKKYGPIGTNFEIIKN
ncbi:MAG: hypothetical protein ACI4IQ_00005 [Eubacterium sp.]